MVSRPPNQQPGEPGSLGFELTGLYDCARLARELHISRTAAERIMRHVPKQQVPGLRKVYVRGADVQRFLDENIQPA
jgi:hypothetical protein